jgi:hypothetical protein
VATWLSMVAIDPLSRPGVNRIVAKSFEEIALPHVGSMRLLSFRGIVLCRLSPRAPPFLRPFLLQARRSRIKESRGNCYSAVIPECRRPWIAMSCSSSLWKRSRKSAFPVPAGSSLRQGSAPTMRPEIGFDDDARDVRRDQEPRRSAEKAVSRREREPLVEPSPLDRRVEDLRERAEQNRFPEIPCRHYEQSWVNEPVRSRHHLQPGLSGIRIHEQEKRLLGDVSASSPSRICSRLYIVATKERCVATFAS